MINLSGKRVLLIAPPFFGYDNDIAGEFARRGAKVVRLADRPFRSHFATAIAKIAPEAVAAAALPAYRRTLEQSGGGFDLCLVVNGQTVAPQLLRDFRAANPTAAMLLYLWDSLSNRPSVRRALSLYDRVMGFDRGDAETLGFDYRPLFYSNAFQSSSERPTLDISFAGTAHSDRAPIVWDIETGLSPSIARHWFLYLQAGWTRRYYALRSGRFRQVPEAIFSYRPMAKSDLASLFGQSRAILDIEHPAQRGLTMRTFETLGAGKKLVTTNRHVEAEPFYHQDRVLIIDRHRPVVPESFLKSPIRPLNDDMLRRYSLAGWLDEILTGLALRSSTRSSGAFAN